MSDESTRRELAEKISYIARRLNMTDSYVSREEIRQDNWLNCISAAAVALEAQDPPKGVPLCNFCGEARVRFCCEECARDTLDQVDSLEAKIAALKGGDSTADLRTPSERIRWGASVTEPEGEEARAPSGFPNQAFADWINAMRPPDADERRALAQAVQETMDAAPTAPPATPELEAKLMEIEARLQAATPGPWEVAGSDGDRAGINGPSGFNYELGEIPGQLEVCGLADASLIAGAPADLRFLISTIRTLAADLAHESELYGRLSAEYTGVEVALHADLAAARAEVERCDVAIQERATMNDNQAKIIRRLRTEDAEAQKQIAAGNLEIARLREELRVRDADAAAAAGELMVEIPVPGSDSAKVMIANRLIRDERDALREELRAAREQRTFKDIGAERLADEVSVLIQQRVIDSRSPAADAMLDFRDGTMRSPRSDRLAALEAELRAAKGGEHARIIAALRKQAAKDRKIDARFCAGALSDFADFLEREGEK